MSIIYIDQEKCIKCSACANICPSNIIEMTEQGPQENIALTCIQCGHCVAVCPVAALDNKLCPLSAQVPLEKSIAIEPDTAARFLRSRRSIRSYKTNQVPKDKLLQLLDIARFAPSGSNTQGLSYLVISDLEKLEKIKTVIVEWLEQELKSSSSLPPSYIEAVNDFRNGKDTILRGAPHLILALSLREIIHFGVDSAKFALGYVELFAPSLGIGTCWVGLVHLCAIRKHAPLLDILSLPSNKVLVGAIIAGYPKYRYQRLVDRNPLDVSWS